MAYGSSSVGSSATLIVDGNVKRKSIVIVNTDNTLTVYIGPDADVTTENGIPLYPNQANQSDKIPELYLGPIYGIVSSGSSDVRYWEKTT